MICFSVEDLRVCFAFDKGHQEKTVFFCWQRCPNRQIVCCVPEPLASSSLSKHLPSSDSMSLKVDVEALENSPGATYIRKKGGKVTGDNQPKEQG